MMQNMFALRRQTIVMSSPPVKELMDLWPAFHMQSENYTMSTHGIPLFSMLFLCFYVRKSLDFSEHVWMIWMSQTWGMHQWSSLQSSVMMPQAQFTTTQ
ncbi:hypothetical protein CHARACLAT_033170 [Characodon lateralis]|uniref:ATP synthase F0 subunit 6 n=1 Tax=Characodon lateralis TaxID=208331 RepID=A0ABU7DYB4_9TELE|nr:hypothetical protein [Characodon lateralis]